MTAPVTSPYLEGPYAPVHQEITASDLVVQGEIPRDLRGMFVRNSSNPRFTPEGRYHWFDGDGMVHGVHFADGGATYRNRWVRTKAFVAESEAGHALWTGVTERPDFTNPRGPFKDTANTDLVFHAGQLLALWWLGGEAYILRLPQLDTCGTQNYGGKVPTLSAHPKVDATTGEMMFFDYKPQPPYLRHGVVRPDGTLAHYTTIELPGPRLQHDMAITQNYSILLDMSLMWDPAELMRGRSRVRFFRDKPTRFGLLPRHASGDQIRWFDAAPCYMYHTINAWESGSEVVLIGCRIENPLSDDETNPPSDRPIPTIGFLRLEPRLYRWTFNLHTGGVKEEYLDDVLTEFPRMDNRVLGRRSRYSYNPRICQQETIQFDGLIKYDTDTGRTWTHTYPAGCFGGEVVFAPRSGAAGPGSRSGTGSGTGPVINPESDPDEDDGYLLTFVVNAATGDSELYILHARHVDAEPVARVKIPQRVPIGYHTYWVPTKQLDVQRLPGREAQS